MDIDAQLSLIGVASATDRQDKAENQDYVGITFNPNLAARAVIIADGIGSHLHAGLGAKWAVEEASALIKSASRLTEQDLRDVFLNTRAKVKECANSFCAHEEVTADKNQSFGTTLIIGVEDPTSFIIAYVGNGAIWHIRGNFNDFSSNQYPPWNALNYLNPHTIPNEAGKEALYRLISISNDNDETVPTILRIEKDHTYGDILMICTDGVYSCDQLNIGRRTKDGSLWIEAEPSMLSFFNALDSYFSSSEPFTNDSLTEALNQYLLHLCSDGLLEDDASLGVIATAATLEYQYKRKGAAAI